MRNKRTATAYLVRDKRTVIDAYMRICIVYAVVLAYPAGILVGMFTG